MEHTLALITLAHQGDKAARDTLIEENIGLVWSIVRRFQNRGVETEDLFQIGSIGLIKAVDKFDPAYQVQFSTYAVPMIAGEIRRFLRDDGMLKVSRSLKELAGRIYSTKDALEKKNGREPTLYEVARELGVSQEDLVLAMEAATQVESLQQVIYQGEGNDISLMDKLEEEEKPERPGGQPATSGRYAEISGRQRTSADLYALFSGKNSGSHRTGNGNLAGTGFPAWRKRFWESCGKKM